MAGDAHYEVYEDKAGEWRWRLQSANGEIVASGEGYDSRAGAEGGVSAAHRASAEATFARVTYQARVVDDDE